MIATKKSVPTLVLIALALMASTACHRSQAADAAASGQMRSVPVHVTQVVQKDITEELALTGTLKPRAQVQVVSEVSARMLRLLHDEGEAVRQDEVIAILDSTDAKLVHERAAAVVAVAEANRQHAVAERDRADHLLKTGGITDKDHLSAEVDLQVAEASLKQARAEAAIAAQQLARCEIRAPFAGRIAKRLVDPGAMLANGTAVVNLVDNSVLEFRAAVSSEDFSKVREGAAAVITVDAIPGLSLRGAITRILPTMDERSRSFDVVIQVPGQANLASGMFARARIKVRDIAAAVVVPPAALMHDGARPGFASLFVVEAGKAQSREVALGVETLDVVEIRSGVKPGQTIVVDPPTTLASGVPLLITDGNRKD
jgi:RND family efflux transporter MFP subunit